MDQTKAVVDHAQKEKKENKKKAQLRQQLTINVTELTLITMLTQPHPLQHFQEGISQLLEPNKQPTNK